ncbi:hypothetical protein ACFFX0_24840 [Citricoccus parietis]|uniref:Uncharacterized protein n=1 Tax=Citricoccus parietis TaxID=592307 RepID=A0ABV5G5M9_9MICC
MGRRGVATLLEDGLHEAVRHRVGGGQGREGRGVGVVQDPDGPTGGPADGVVRRW